MGKIARKVLVSFCVACILLDVVADAFIITKRATSEPMSEKSIECQKNTPCGWAVYKRFTRKIDYFMKNKCECPRGKRCALSDDDISVQAYVYRCKLPDNPEGDGSS